jgi:hypothetical protein
MASSPPETGSLTDAGISLDDSPEATEMDCKE